MRKCSYMRVTPQKMGEKCALEYLPPYYRIAVGNYLVLYCVIGKVMEVRRFVYAPSDWRAMI